MSGWMSWVTGAGKSNQDTAREAIVSLRQQLLLLEKKEEHLNKKIDDELKKAKANATTNKRVATAALRQKKFYENELDSLAGTRLTLETQVNTIESANLHLQTMKTMERGGKALAAIQKNMTPDRVDAVMDSIREQTELAKEIQEAISNPGVMGTQIDDSELESELAELEQEELNARLAGAEPVPLHTPSGVRAPPQKQQVEEDEEEEELRQLQAAMA